MITLPLPPDMIRCYGDAFVPGGACRLASKCARHLTRVFDKTQRQEQLRCCHTDYYEGYIPADGYPPRDDTPFRPNLVLADSRLLAVTERTKAIEALDAQPDVASNAGSAASDIPPSAISAEGCAVAPVAEQSAPAANERLCCGAARIIGITAVEVAGDLRRQLDEALARIRILEADVDSKAQRIALLDAEILFKRGVISQLMAGGSEAEKACNA